MIDEYSIEGGQLTTLANSVQIRLDDFRVEGRPFDRIVVAHGHTLRIDLNLNEELHLESVELGHRTASSDPDGVDASIYFHSSVQRARVTTKVLGIHGPANLQANPEADLHFISARTLLNPGSTVPPVRVAECRATLFISAGRLDLSVERASAVLAGVSGPAQVRVRM